MCPIDKTAATVLPPNVHSLLYFFNKATLNVLSKSRLDANHSQPPKNMPKKRRCQSAGQTAAKECPESIAHRAMWTCSSIGSPTTSIDSATVMNSSVSLSPSIVAAAATAILSTTGGGLHSGNANERQRRERAARRRSELTAAGLVQVLVAIRIQELALFPDRGIDAGFRRAKQLVEDVVRPAAQPAWHSDGISQQPSKRSAFRSLKSLPVLKSTPPVLKSAVHQASPEDRIHWGQVKCSEMNAMAQHCGGRTARRRSGSRRGSSRAGRHRPASRRSTRRCRRGSE